MAVQLNQAVTFKLMWTWNKGKVLWSLWKFFQRMKANTHALLLMTLENQSPHADSQWSLVRFIVINNF